MKRKVTKVLGFTIFALLLVAMFAFSVFAEDHSGDFYEGLSYSFSGETGVLTISGEGTVLGVLNDAEAIVGVSYDGVGLPWKDEGWSGEVNEVVITAPITEAKSYMLIHLANCTKITIPATLKKIGQGIFAYNKSLNTVVVAGNDPVEGVMDFRNFENIPGYLFDDALNNSTPVVYLGKNLTKFDVNKMAQKCQSLTFKIYPGSVAEAWFARYDAGEFVGNANVCPNVTYAYYSIEELGDIPASGESTANGFKFLWSFDADTETLTFSSPEGVTGWNELGTQNTSILSDIAFWKRYVKHIVVSGKFSKIQINGVSSIFAGYPELLDIDFGAGTGFTEIQASGTTGLFEGNKKMNAIGFGTLTEGVADLSRIGKVSGSGLFSLFKDCEAIKSVKFKEGFLNHSGKTYTKIDSSMFEGCTSLESIILPAQLTELATHAFEGCTSLKSIVFEGSPLTFAEGAEKIFPDNEGLVITTRTLEDADLINGLGLEKAVAIKVIEPIGFIGYSVRTEEYNGIRGVFSFNNDEMASLKENGYYLVEYGALVASKANADKFGMEITKSGSKYVSADASVLKKAVYRTDVIVDKILDHDGDDTRFALSIVNIPENKMMTDLVMTGYAVVRTPAGEDMIIYANNEAVNLQYISTQMYKNGLVSFESDADEIVFDAMMSGVVTLEWGTQFKKVEGQKTLDGTDIGDTFKFENVPMVYQTLGEGGVLTFEASNVNVTLVKDGEYYVAVYRGEGALPGASQYGINSYSQLSKDFMKTGSKILSVPTNVPNPTLENYVSSRIKTAIVCEGITSFGGEAFSTVGIATIMYPKSLNNVVGAQFQGNKSINTMFRTGDVAEIGLMDLSYIETVELSYTFNSAEAISKLHLPANITSIGTETFASKKAMKGIWCGDGEYTEGVADFSNTSLASLSKKAFKNVVGINTVKLPDTVTSIAQDGAGNAVFYGMNGAGVEGSDTKVTVTTPNANEALTNYVSDAGIAAYVIYKSEN